MNEFVVDCSITGAWFLDEPNSYALRILDELTPRALLWVPVLWHYEFANMLAVAKRQKRITSTHIDKIISKVKLLPFKVDIGSLNTLAQILDLAISHALSAYDAAYLELSLKKDLPLATLDRQLLKAASKAGARLLE